MPGKPSYRVATNPQANEANRLGLNVLFAGESQTKPLHKLGPKVYEYYLLHYIIAGGGEFSTEQSAYTLQAGDSFLIEPGKLVSYRSDKTNPWRYCWVAFHGEQADELVQKAGITHPPVIRGGPAKIASLIRAIITAFRTRGRLADMKACGHLCLIAAALGEAQTALDPDARMMDIQQIVKQAVDYLTTQFAQNISIEQMAESLGYNRGYLSRMFKKATGESPSHYLLKFRLEQSRRLLRERNELNIGQIAASVGFQDALYFSKQFKRFYGESPAAYRKAVQGGKTWTASRRKKPRSR
ncbi:MAG TPA: AraC family transcriptional regulator [Bacilli bacterium]